MIRKTLKENKNHRPKTRPAFLPPKNFFIFGTVVVLGLPLALVVAFLLAFNGRIYPRVTVCQTSLTGKTPKEAASSLADDLKNRFPEKLILVYEEQKFPLDLKSLQYSPPSTSQKAFRVSREGSPEEKGKQLVLLIRQGKDIAFDFQFDGEKLESEMATIGAKLYLPAIEPGIKIVKNAGRKTLVIETGKNGREVDLRLLKKEINRQLGCPQKEIALPIPLITVSPQISTAMADATKARAEKLLDKSLKLKLNDQTWTVDDEEIISFLSFKEGFDRQKISDFTKDLAKTVNSLPEDAAFRFENDRVTLFRPAKEGITLEEARFSESFAETLTLLEQSEQSQVIEIPITKTPPKISMAEVNSLGIKELLGRGSSLFYGSISERIHNIDLASLRLSGTLVAPGEEFSFNKTLGDVSTATGYKQAYIIKEGRTVLGDGGGVCQVSTTLFRAILNAGLPITERHAHAYRVHYYEDDLGPGFDATVFDPTADLKFKNDTPAYLLIQSTINLKSKKLIFEVYGTGDNRRAEISKARVWDKVPPPPDLYQDDPTLPAGTVKQIDWKAWGAKASFDYKVTRGGDILFKKTFYSNYLPWQAVYLRGTGR